MSGVAVRLRPYREEDLDVVMNRFMTEPATLEPLTWFGYRSSHARRLRWEEDNFLEKDPRLLVITLGSDDNPIGHMSWRDASLISPGTSWEIGILMLPEYRGQGAGSEAQRLMVEHLFSTTTAHRICAHTEAENLAEQKALEKCGFQREGLLRQVTFRAGAWRDVLIYGLLRDEC